MESHGVEAFCSLFSGNDFVQRSKQTISGGTFVGCPSQFMVSCVSRQPTDKNKSRCRLSSTSRKLPLSRSTFINGTVDVNSDLYGSFGNYGENMVSTSKAGAANTTMVEAVSVKPVKQTGNSFADLCINTIRFLAIDAVEKAKSGHPGMPMGMAPVAHVLFDNFLKFNPKNPYWGPFYIIKRAWFNAAICASLSSGYDSVTLEDIKKFRQIHSKTPGHPENFETPGVETTTGPLGQGIANAQEFYNKPGHELIDHHTYVFVGDGCLMEGISNEASSLAGHLKKLIAIYDDNKISIDGNTSCAFSEDVAKRYEALGWHVLTVENGNTDLQSLHDAIQTAKRVTDKPSLIQVKTVIGYGSPNKANTGEVHGSALGADEVTRTRESLGWQFKEFQVPDEVLNHYRKHIEMGEKLEQEWKSKWESYKKAFPELATQFERTVIHKQLPNNWEEALLSAAEKGGDMATRQASQAMLNALAPIMPELVGGSADLAPSCLTMMKNVPAFQSNCNSGRYFHYGVREHAMGAISNGIFFHQTGLRPFAATFFIFTDYMRASIRLSALSRAGIIYIMTHDSIALGEDGPTHQPVEHLASFRAMPNTNMIRPADVTETAAAYMIALKSPATPSILALSRQKLPKLKSIYPLGQHSWRKASGLYSYRKWFGSASLRKCSRDSSKRRQAIRVVSFPCWELFEQQPREYKESVFPSNVPKSCRLACEAGSSFGWDRYVEHSITVDSFGLSGKGDDLLQYFGFTSENIVKQVKALL
eukprot:jgi/Galph1/399/GphlegSOOS_G5203.1